MTQRNGIIAAVVIVLLAIGGNAYLGLDNSSRITGIIKQSRKEGCESSERLRAQVRSNVRKEEEELPKILKLLPTLNTPQGKELAEKRFALQLSQAAPVDCVAYARLP